MQRVVAVFLLCSVHAAFGCVPFGPGGDDGELQPFELTNSPRFTLVYSPPVGWTTAPANPTTEQAKDVDEAKLQILINVVEAFRVGFASLNAVLPTSIEYNVDAMRPEERMVAADGAVPNAEEGLLAAGVMDRVCRPTSPATTFSPCRMAPSNGTYEEAIQEAEEQVEKIKLPQEPMNEIVDSILPPNYSMDENSRVAISRALSIFTVPPKKHERRVAGDDAIEQEADSSDEAEAEPQ
ncbi:hypothetical protein M3Y99_01215600 [Aphelenchoides fujianensis]|nr:hypothetical protein M3Y99_01215600 [Aphelenchoides fujianensis]